MRWWQRLATIAVSAALAACGGGGEAPVGDSVALGPQVPGADPGQPQPAPRPEAPVGADPATDPPAQAEETQLGTISEGSQTFAGPAALAQRPQGGFVVGWDTPEARFIRLDELGAPVGHDQALEPAFASAFAALSDGGFMALGYSADNLYSTTPWLQRFDPQGRPVGDRLDATGASAYRGGPTVAITGLPGNRVLVTASAMASVSGRIDNHMRILHADGTPIGPELRLTSESADGVRVDPPTAALLPGGRFAVSWMERVRETGAVNIVLRLHDAQGTLEASERRIPLPQGVEFPWNGVLSMITLSDGNLLLAWEEASGDRRDFRGVIVDPQGAVVRAPFALLEAVGSDVEPTMVAAPLREGFALAWRHGTVQNGMFEREIRVQRMSAQGEPIGEHEAAGAFQLPQPSAMDLSELQLRDRFALAGTADGGWLLVHLRPQAPTTPVVWDIRRTVR